MREREFLTCCGVTCFQSSRQSMNETDAKAVTEVLDSSEGDNELLFCHMEGGLIYAAAGQVERASPLSILHVQLTLHIVLRILKVKDS